MSDQAVSQNLRPVDAEHGNLDYHDALNITNPEHVAHHIVSPFTASSSAC